MKNKFASGLTLLLLFILLSTVNLNAGNSIDQQLFTSLHGHGSMNVVMAVIGIILAGLFITLWRIDRKVSKLEKDIKEK